MKMKMKKLISIIAAVSLVFGVMGVSAYAVGETDYTIINPYESVDWAKVETYKACLHAHTTASDGDVELSDMVQAYYDAGYDILAITDHGVINTGWRDDRETHGIFNSFRKVEPMSEEQYERLTTGADRNGRGIVDITGGIECNMAVVSKTHVNGYWTTYGSGVWGTENDYKTATVEIEKAGGYSVLNHVGDWTNSNHFPERSHWNEYISYFADIFTTSKSCLGMEIVNSRDVVSRYDRELWDELLQVVIPTGRNIWAFADDDSEQLYEVGRAFEYFPLEENTEANVKEAMINGAFFSSSIYYYPDGVHGEKLTGDGATPIVTGITVDEKANTISVEIDPTRDCKEILWYADGEVISNDFTIDLNDYEDELGCYVRFELYGEGGTTYSQAFELRYEGRQDKSIPTSSIPDNEDGEAFLAIYHTLPFALCSFIIEKLAALFGLI